MTSLIHRLILLIWPELQPLIQTEIQRAIDAERRRIEREFAQAETKPRRFIGM